MYHKKYYPRQYRSNIQQTYNHIRLEYFLHIKCKYHFSRMFLFNKMCRWMLLHIQSSRLNKQYKLKALINKWVNLITDPNSKKKPVLQVNGIHELEQVAIPTADPQLTQFPVPAPAILLIQIIFTILSSARGISWPIWASRAGHTCSSRLTKTAAWDALFT